MGLVASLPLKPIPGHSHKSVMNNIHGYEEDFAARYEAAYLWFLTQKIHNEIEAKSTTPKWQLQQRKWNAYNRPLTEGILYVLSKSEGKRWRKRYCVLQPDYALDVYTSKNEYESAAKPRSSNKYSGHFLAADVDGYLQKKLEIQARDLGYVNYDLDSFGRKVTLIGQAGKRPSLHMFSVDHPWRGMSYFAAESSAEKDRWVGMLRDGMRRLDGCLCEDEVARDAFIFAVEQSLRAEEACIDQSVLSGTQEEILTFLICALQSRECKEVVLPRITGGIVRKHKAWNFVLSSIHRLIKGVVQKQYLGWREDCEERCHAKRQEIIVNLPQLTITYEATARVVKESLAECFDPILNDEIIPKLPDVISTMSDSLVHPLRATREMFKSLVNDVLNQASTSSQFANNIDRYFLNRLDFAPRDPQFTCPSGDMSASVKTPLSILQSAFPQTDFVAHLKNIYIYQQQLLDSAVCTFEALCGESVNKNGGKLTIESIAKVQNRVLKRLDYDVLLAQRRFFRTVILSATMQLARESIEEHCKPKMLDFQSTIPEELREFLPINNVFTDVLTKHFTELVNPVINRCMKQLTLDNATFSALRLSSNFSSLSSFVSTDSELPVKENRRKNSQTNSMGEPFYLAEGSGLNETETRQQPLNESPSPGTPTVVEAGRCFSDLESGEAECYHDDMDGETGEYSNRKTAVNDVTNGLQASNNDATTAPVLDVEPRPTSNVNEDVGQSGQEQAAFVELTDDSSDIDAPEPDSYDPEMGEDQPHPDTHEVSVDVHLNRLSPVNCNGHTDETGEPAPDFGDQNRVNGFDGINSPDSRQACHGCCDVVSNDVIIGLHDANGNHDLSTCNGINGRS
ncbi:protein Niban 2-like [Clavelina lepadiformis]|uniref:protein Niban 2-like n=1 Tax=Clavelina lepadiformis TaxID=159417 RepID=UPI0040414B7B